MKQKQKICTCERPSYWISLKKEITPKVAEFRYEICRMLLCHEIYIFHIFLLTHADEVVPSVIAFMEKLMAGC